ncbi:SDR family oxidoreductase [Rhodococcus sp. 1168]|uniref:SDR family NAD(P)-dependent oxidoreductase n=1 Tax=Rhodococcus sp. 1168 TaxID=2018041 RepID=UPI000A0DA2E6|nr:SDR family NAD(P)-dependent oxidoreductase [Rhodococcus sp. 1168]ORI24939.1 short-chain dehydrogenase [Rhodococcus sp. 1168]
MSRTGSAGADAVNPYRGRFVGRAALVTGAGSGIGAALAAALVKAGAYVVCTDLDQVAARRTAAALGPQARAEALDVTDPEQVLAAVDRVVAEHGRIDLIFNNAGITFGGEAEHLTLAQWNQIIDVNLRGVVHGIHAAYPKMIAQGNGHIVNTASAGGLMAAGLITSYVATKHAVVGLSLALRTEAAAKGVGVTVICPGAVDTPILDKGSIDDFVGRDYYLRGQRIKTPHSPEKLADEVLAAVAGNKAILVTPRSARLAWRFNRLAPGLMQRSSILFVARQRKWQAQRAHKVEKASAR